jgi:hypothetical protein
LGGTPHPVTVRRSPVLETATSLQTSGPNQSYRVAMRETRCLVAAGG